MLYDCIFFSDIAEDYFVEKSNIIMKSGTEFLILKTGGIRMKKVAF